MPDTYSWVANTTSESAAQAVRGAWVARLGFVFFGTAVVWLAALKYREWGFAGALLHGGFGVLMLSAAIFSHKPFERGVPFDAFEDMLHSIAATGIGFAFAFGVVAVGLRRGLRLLDVLALIASVAVPLAMVTLADYAGVLQRTMFLIAFAYYGMESRRTNAEPDQAGAA